MSSFFWWISVTLGISGLVVVFSGAKDEGEEVNAKPLTREMYQKLLEHLTKRSKDAILPVQIAYFTGL